MTQLLKNSLFVLVFCFILLAFSSNVFATLQQEEGEGCQSSSDCSGDLVCSGGTCSQASISCEGGCPPDQACDTDSGVCHFTYEIDCPVEGTDDNKKCTAVGGEDCSEACDSCADLETQAARDECNGMVNDADATCYATCSKNGGSNCAERCNPDNLGDCAEYDEGADCGTCYECVGRGNDDCPSCGGKEEIPPCANTCECGNQPGPPPECKCPTIVEADCEPCGVSDGCGGCDPKPTTTTRDPKPPCPCGALSSSSSDDECGNTHISWSTENCGPDSTSYLGCTSNSECYCGYCQKSSGGTYCNPTITGTCVSTKDTIRITTTCDPNPPSCEEKRESRSTSGCTTTITEYCVDTSNTIYEGPSSCSLDCESLESTSSTSGCTTTITRYCDDSACETEDVCDPMPARDDTSFDEDNDGINDCWDECAGNNPTPQTDTDGNGIDDNEEVNTDTSSSVYGCSCSQLTYNETPYYECGQDGCKGDLDLDYYEYPGPFADACSNGVITRAKDLADCGPSITPNDPRCDPCMDAYGVNTDSTYQTVQCPDDYCTQKPRYDGTNATVGDFYSYESCRDVCRMNENGTAYLERVEPVTIKENYYDWDNCVGCTVPRCEDGDCGFVDVDDDSVCDDYDECLSTTAGGGVVATADEDIDGNGIREKDEVVLEGCSNIYLGAENCPTYEPKVGDAQNITGCACSEIDLYEQDCPDDRCKANDYCANPGDTGTFIDYPDKVEDRCTAYQVDGMTYINITEAGTCSGLAKEIENSRFCDPCAEDSNLTKPDCDGDGVNTCVDKCPNTPAGEIVNQDGSVFHGCSCDQIEAKIGGFGSKSCPEDKCILDDWYDYPDSIPTTCTDGVVTEADSINCESQANISENDPECNVCTDSDPTNDPDLDNDTIPECGQDQCVNTSQVDMNNDGIPEYQQVNLLTEYNDTLGCSCYQLREDLNNYTCEDECIGTDYYEYEGYRDSCFNGRITRNNRSCSEAAVLNITEDHPTCCALVDTDNDGISDCYDECQSTPQTDTDSNGVADYLEVNNDSSSEDYGCACSELSFSDIDCTGSDGCEYNKDPETYPEAIKLWYNYPDKITATCSNGLVSYSGNCSPTVDESIDCVTETTVDFDNFINFECESTVECPFGYRCEGDTCIIDGVDRDGDGYYTTPYLFVDGDYSSIKPVDCNDGNPLINPGMNETYYNGYDDDCDPATPDADQDGDGYRAQIIVDPYYVGGKGVYDCDDLDPSVTTECNNQDVCEVLLG